MVHVFQFSVGQLITCVVKFTGSSTTSPTFGQFLLYGHVIVDDVSAIGVGVIDVCVIGVGRKVTKDLDVNFKPISQINLTAVSEQVLGKTEFELAQLMQSVKSYLENPHTML